MWVLVPLISAMVELVSFGTSEKWLFHKSMLQTSAANLLTCYNTLKGIRSATHTYSAGVC